jgi:hypothetical protein
VPEPGGGRPNWLAIAISVALHSLLFLIVIHGVAPVNPSRPSRILLLPLPGPDRERTTPVPYYVPRIDLGPGVHPQVLPPELPRLVDSTVAERPVPEAPGSDTASVARSPAGRIAPGLATGRLWVRPLPLPPRELAKRLQRTHIELVDSAVTAIVQGYLDSMAREPGADRVKLPDWTATVNGAKFGLDSRNIYIAGLKIPAAVLALLPIPAGGNQAQALDHNGQWIAEDLRRAAQRASTLDEFRQAVRELREQKQWEKDMQRAQRQVPDSATRAAP